MKRKLTKGTKIYYHGDMCNHSGFGIITDVIIDQWGHDYMIEMEDGRKMNRISSAMFSEKFGGGGLTNFVTKEAYLEYRKEELKRIGL